MLDYKGREWKEIPGYNKDYSISSEGIVNKLTKPTKHCPMGEMIKINSFKEKNGLDYVAIHKADGQQVFESVVKLYALAFIDNPNNVEVATFKDRKKGYTKDNVIWQGTESVTWRTIPGIRDVYEVSNDGRVRSKAKTDTWKLLTAGVTTCSNRLQVKVRTEDGRTVCTSIAKLMATAFLENPNNYRFIRFKDGNVNNLVVGNLEWVATLAECKSPSIPEVLEEPNKVTAQPKHICIKDIPEEPKTPDKYLVEVKPTKVTSLDMGQRLDKMKHEREKKTFVVKQHTTEEWAPISGYKGMYEISSKGRVKSVARVSGGLSRPRMITEKLLSPILVNGQLYVTLWNSGDQAKYCIPHLVYATFGNPNIPGYIEHRDRDYTNNCITNLHVCSIRQERGAARNGFILGPIDRRLKLEKMRNQQTDIDLQEGTVVEPVLPKQQVTNVIKPQPTKPKEESKMVETISDVVEMEDKLLDELFEKYSGDSKAHAKILGARLMQQYLKKQISFQELMLKMIVE